jgi:hypothetical protein
MAKQGREADKNRRSLRIIPGVGRFGLLRAPDLFSGFRRASSFREFHAVLGGNAELAP